LFGIANLFIFRKIANHDTKALPLHRKSIVFRGQLHCFCTAISMLLKRKEKDLIFCYNTIPFQLQLNCLKKHYIYFKGELKKEYKKNKVID
jgi:hypothetical protein